MGRGHCWLLLLRTTRIGISERNSFCVNALLQCSRKEWKWVLRMLQHRCVSQTAAVSKYHENDCGVWLVQNRKKSVFVVLCGRYFVCSLFSVYEEVCRWDVPYHCRAHGAGQLSSKPVGRETVLLMVGVFLFR